MKYRVVNRHDVEALSYLFDAYRVFYRKNSDIESALLFLSDRIKNADSKIFVAENNEKQLVGFVQLYPLFSSTRMKKLWILNDLFVDANYRGQGIAINLIEKAKQLVIKSGACGMYLETEKSNVIGNSLYPKMGFILNTEANFYEWNQ